MKKVNKAVWITGFVYRRGGVYYEVAPNGKIGEISREEALRQKRKFDEGS